MNYKRLLSLLITYTLFLNLCTIGISAYAEAPGELGETQQIEEIETTTADYPILIDGRINTARLTRIGEYSKLASEEKEAVCSYYRLTNEIFTSCESLG